MGTVCQHICFKSRKAQPLELIYFKCSVYAQVILKINSKYPEKLKKIVFQPKKFLIGRHKRFSVLLICRNEWKKSLFEVSFPKDIITVLKASSQDLWCDFSLSEILQSSYPSCTRVGYSIPVPRAGPLGMHLPLKPETTGRQLACYTQSVLRDFWG